MKIFEYSNIFVTLWTRLAPVLCFYNLNSIFDHCYEQNIHKHSLISIKIKQKNRRNLKIDTNKYPNIFVSKSCYEWISEYIRIEKVDTNEYPNIFISRKLTRTNVRIYSYPKNDTNEYPNRYLDHKYLNIRIFEYIRHTLGWICSILEGPIPK